MRNSLMRRGFTLVELLVVIVIIGAMTAFAVPRVAQTVIREAVRGSRMTMTTQLARARGAAANRGCRGVVHITTGSNAMVWVTACQINGTGIDTVGAFENLSNRFGVTVASTVDSISYAPTGLATSTSWASLRFTRGAYSDTLAISPVGRAIW